MCSDSPSGESTLEKSICSTALGQSICVISTWYLIYSGCGFRSVPDVGTLSQCYLLYGRAVDASLPKPCPIFHPNWYGGTFWLPQGTGEGQQ